MNNLFTPEFFFTFFYSVLAIFISIFIPGYVLLKYLRLGQSFLFTITQSFVIGTSLWVILGFLLGFFNLRILSYVYILVFACFFLLVTKKRIPRINIGKKEAFALFLILIGVFIQTTSAFFMGVRSMEGLSFCCVDISDNLYFASLSQAVVSNVPPYEPGLYGVVVHNYHYLSNIFIGELSRVFLLPVSILQFQVSNVYLPIMLGLTTLVFGRQITTKWRFSYWLLFFVYFGGDFVWLILLLRNNANIFSMSSLEDGVKFLSNPPRAYAVVQFLGGLSLLKISLEKKEKRSLMLVASLVFGTLIGLKVYIGAFGLVGLGAIALLGVLKRNYYSVMLFICALILSLVIYVPVNKGAGGLYFTSFWFFENFVVQPGLHLERLELARRIFFDDQKLLKSYVFDALFMLLTIFALFGTKLIGLIQGKASLKILTFPFHVFFLSGLIVSFILGFFFQQSSGGSNTFNFIVNIFIVLSIYCATTMTWFTSKYRKLGIIAGVLIVLLTIPRVAYEFQRNIVRITSWNVTTFPKNEIKGLEFLSLQPRGLVLVDHEYFKLDEISPYMSLYAKQPMYLSGIGILDSHGVNVGERKKQYEMIIGGLSIDVARALFDSKISYIITGTNKLDSHFLPFISTVYSSDKMYILRVDRQKLSKYLVP